MASKISDIQKIYDNLLLIQELLSEINKTINDVIKDAQTFGGEINRVIPLKIKIFLQELVKLSTDTSKDYSIASLIKFLDALPLASLRSLGDEENILDSSFSDLISDNEGDLKTSQLDMQNPDMRNVSMEGMEDSDEMKEAIRNVKMKENVLKNLLYKDKLNFEQIKENLEPLKDDIIKSIYKSDVALDANSLINKVKRNLEEKEKTQEISTNRGSLREMKDWRNLVDNDATLNTELSKYMEKGINKSVSSDLFNKDVDDDFDDIL